jgi:hypothetical protein
MLLVQYVLIASLLFSSSIILFQDFKHRLVSLWVLLLFGLTCICSVLINRNIETLFYNILFTIIYIGLIWLILKLYLYLKFRRNKRILNEQLGLADVLTILFVGLTFNAVGLVFFFCFGFIFSLLSYVIYMFVSKHKKNEHIPLAGLLVLFYVLTIFILYLNEVNNYIDCSFIN